MALGGVFHIFYKKKFNLIHKNLAHKKSHLENVMQLSFSLLYGSAESCQKSYRKEKNFIVVVVAAREWKNKHSEFSKWKTSCWHNNNHNIKQTLKSLSLGWLESRTQKKIKQLNIAQSIKLLTKNPLSGGRCLKSL